MKTTSEPIPFFGHLNMEQDICSVCSCEFSLDEEGGISGDFGIIPVSFCPNCLCCMMDMADQLRGDEEPIFQQSA
jgi:hypothetical protein